MSLTAQLEKLDAHIRKLKVRVRRHGRYAEVAEATGLSASFVQKFATDNRVEYESRSLLAVEAFLSGNRGASARKR